MCAVKATFTEGCKWNFARVSNILCPIWVKSKSENFCTIMLSKQSAQCKPWVTFQTLYIQLGKIWYMMFAYSGLEEVWILNKFMEGRLCCPSRNTWIYIYMCPVKPFLNVKETMVNFVYITQYTVCNFVVLLSNIYNSSGETVNRTNMYKL